MQARQDGHRHLLSIARGEEIVEQVQQYALQQGIVAGTVTGIGAAERIVLRYYDRAAKDYVNRTFDGACEIASLTGNISLNNGKPWPHLHVVISGRDFHAYAGHLASARVSAACEVIIDASQSPIHRMPDMSTGLHLWSL